MSSLTTRAFGAARQRLATYAPLAESVPALALDLVARAAPKRTFLPQLEPADGPLQRAARALRAGTLSAQELVEGCLAAINQCDPAMHAIVVNLGESAVMQAQAMDDSAARGQWRGPLHGIPFTVKDNIDMLGAPTRAGSDAFYREPPHDAEAVAGMRAAGAIPIAKVATHEFALGVTTPQARHPLDPRRIPGGSSGGSAISIATGMALASLGTDTRASIRVPAALCGVVGYKPTSGWLPRGGVVWLSWTMDQVGVLAASVGDAAYVADALLPERQLLSACGTWADGMRLGVSRAGFIGAIAPVDRAVRASLDALAARGVTLVEVDVPSESDFELANAAGLIISRAEALEYHRSMRTDLNRVWRETADQLYAAQQLTLHEYLDAQRFRTELADRVLRVMTSQELDALVMPTTLVQAPPVEDAEQHFTALSRNAIPWSLIGWPVVSVPCGGDSSALPIGLQVVAPPGEDGQALRVAGAMEARG